MPQYRKCTEEDVYRILLEVTARGESPTREDLAEKVAVECNYKIKTARNLVKNSERMGFIKCSGWGRESLCKPVKEHYVDVARTLEIILYSWNDLHEIDLRGKGISEEALENALTHVVSRDRNSLAVARGVIRWWRKFEELRQQIYIHTLLLDNDFVQNLKESKAEAKVVEDELRRLNWKIDYWRFAWPLGILDTLDRISDTVVKGELAGRQLDELEGVAPKSIGILRVTVMVKRETLLLVEALLKLREKVDKLKEIIGIVLHHYRKDMRVQGFCSYCVKDVPKEIRNIVKNLWKAIYVTREVENNYRYNQAVYYLINKPLISLASPEGREIIFDFLSRPQLS
jgi:hypothetical protein